MKRVLVIGARQARQGVGPYVARSFHRAGAHVCAVVGTSTNTAAQARDQLKAYGISCRAYADLDTALGQERPDIVAICSPYTVHRPQLEAVAATGAHCLCEKPMWWSPDANRGPVTGRLVDGFANRNLYFDLVTQWPCTLEQYDQLYPGFADGPVDTFAMGLGPATTGPAMIMDAAPHVLSMLWTLVGSGTVHQPEATYSGPDQRQLHLTFAYQHAKASTAVTCRFVTCEHQPREAWYAINGRVARRQVELPSYNLRLESDDQPKREVVLPDPLFVLVEQFLGRVDRAAMPDRQRLVESVLNLERLMPTDDVSASHKQVLASSAGSHTPTYRLGAL